MAKQVGKLFGFKKPKPDKTLEAVQRRQLQTANNERGELEAERADVQGGASRVRSGRSLLTYITQRKTKTGA